MGIACKGHVFGALLVAALLACPAAAEELEGELQIGENLDVYLLPEPGFFNKLFSSVGLSSPPEPVNLTQTAKLGRDEIVLAVDEDGISVDVFAKVRLADEGEPDWYRVGRSTTRYWKMAVKDGVKIMRVKKSALDVFEGTVDGDPWFLRVTAPAGLAADGKPASPDLKFWLSEFVLNYDELSHSGGGEGGKPDNYGTLKKALVTVLPDELDPVGGDAHVFERVKQLADYVRKAGVDELVPLRDLLEAKMERLDALDPDDPDALETARDEYEKLLADLRTRTADG